MRHAIAIQLAVLLSTSLAFAADITDAAGRRPRWLVPPARAAEKNPLQASRGSAERGKQLYEQHCAMCHGDDGRGDGPRSGDLLRQLKGASLDLTAPVIAGDSDGAIFYKIKMGRSPMPPSTGAHGLSDDDRWAVVHYLRAIAPAAARASR